MFDINNGNKFFQIRRETFKQENILNFKNIQHSTTEQKNRRKQTRNTTANRQPTTSLSSTGTTTFTTI